jgi:WD40 repeat protein
LFWNSVFDFIFGHLVPYQVHSCNVAGNKNKTTIPYVIAFQVVNEPTDAHCPVVEMTTRSKLSCLSWNKYAKNQIASSDYEGIVTVWDVTTRKVIVNSNRQFFLYHLFEYLISLKLLTVIYLLCCSECFCL